MGKALEMVDVYKQMEDIQIGPINLTCTMGEITTLVGKNGSGKSTLLKMMLNLVKHDQGKIRVFEKTARPSDASWKQEIAYMPQFAVGCHPYTGSALKKIVTAWYPNWDESLFSQLVSRLDIPLNKKYSKLSPGSQQKLQFALNISKGASLLLLDEPTAAMDIPAKQLVMDVLSEWMDTGNRAIITATHQISDMEKLSDYLFVLKEGKAIGNYEKERLGSNFQRYWFRDTLPAITIPGEIECTKDARQIVSSDPEATETFLREQGIQWLDCQVLGLEEAITLLLQD